ncbi:MAG: anti-sigma F factor antagonist [Symbiobacterium thermophilum]|uniref:Anti-sigma F factor antagonist n=1 Tax=Symbiobacterium thermophilum TaxID=2734 RepID=A0A1Y2T0Q9_SYMTR|nr:MAG: anti-sigma F factor antagonist [Symbiobacterium thermophilum]
MSSMEYELVGQSLIVRLSGELDLVAAARFKETVEELMDRRPVRHLYVNLARVTFVDSAFLGALFGRYRRISREGGRVGVIGVPPQVRSALEFSGVLRTMEEFRSEQEALSADGAGSGAGEGAV